MNKNTGQIRFSKLSLGIVVLSLSLLACGGKDVIVTKDNSADYRNAESLPPLKKTATGSPGESLNSQKATTKPRNAVVAIPSYRVIEYGSRHAWLEIDAQLDAAWGYVSNKLSGSDITVYRSNQVASHFAIGCGDIVSGETAKEKSRWSVFKKKQELLEYCELRLTASKANTKVMVFNRSGAEFNAKAARDVFARLLKG